MTPATYAVINLAAIKHNIKKIRTYAPKAKIMAVIKANAYGHGLLRVANVLNDIEAIAVARADEGIQLRQAGITNQITILEGFICEQELNDLIQYGLDVIVHSIEQVNILEKYQGPKKITVWLKLDTGMNRLGFKTSELEYVYQKLLACSIVNQPVSLMTHLSNADDLNSPVTLQQLKLFNEVGHSYLGEKSVANSAAIIAWPESITDWVRPGIMLYGVSPFLDKNGDEFGLKPVMSLHSRLIAVRNIEPDEAVGYAGTWISKANARLGVVAIGYGDGYPRYAKTGTPVLVNRKRVPLVGRVSMDMITVDLTTQENVKPGDPVTLWGEGLPVEEIAKCSDTIPYTLLCGITQRVEIKSKL